MNRPLPIALLTALVAATVLVSPWQRDLYIGDETRYGQVVHEMRSGGSLFVPHLGGKPYSHKPPLHFWSILALTSVFGEGSIWPFVVPSIVAFIALLFIVRILAARLVNARARAVAPFIFATFYLSWGLAQTARMDLQFVALISLAVLCIHRHLTGDGIKDLVLAGVATGCAILIKGPMALVIVLALLLFERIRRGPLRRGPYIVGFVIAAFIPLLWLVPAVLTGGGGYGRELLVEQNVGRAFDSWTHGEPPWFYLIHAPGTFFPWFVLFVVAVFALYRDDRTQDTGHRKQEMPHATASRVPGVEGSSLLSPVSRVLPARALPPDEELAAAADPKFCVSWFLAVLIPFTLISGKLDVYMLPACVPMALIVSGFVTSGVGGVWEKRGVTANVVMLGALALLGSALLAAIPHVPRTAQELRLLDDPRVFWLFVVMVIAAFIGLLATYAKRSGRLLRSSIALGIAALTPMVYIMFTLVPALNSIGSTEPLVRALARLPQEGEEIALFKAPYLWSRSMPESLNGVRYLGEESLDEAWTKPPEVIAVQRDRAHLLEARLQDYIRIDRVRIKSRDFDVYRRR